MYHNINKKKKILISYLRIEMALYLQKFESPLLKDAEIGPVLVEKMKM